MTRADAFAIRTPNNFSIRRSQPDGRWCEIAVRNQGEKVIDLSIEQISQLLDSVGRGRPGRVILDKVEVVISGDPTVFALDRGGPEIVVDKSS